MKKKVQKILSVVVTAVLLAGAPELTSLAAEAGNGAAIGGTNEEGNEIEVLEAEVSANVEWPSEISPYTTMANCLINVVSDSEGMHIGIFTGVVGTASVIGVKDIKIQKKNWLGLWITVATSSGGESYDSSTSSVSILYENAEKDATYRILCVHYGNVDGYRELEHDSGSFVHTY